MVKATYVNWEEINETEIPKKIFKLISEGYIVSIAANIIADEYGLNFSQLLNRVKLKYRYDFPNEYKKSLLEGKKRKKERNKITREDEQLIIQIFNDYINNSKSTTEAAIEAGRKLNIYPVECYEKWNMKLKHITKENTRNSENTEDNIDFKSKLNILLELHSDKILDDSQLITSLYKLCSKA